MNAVLMKRRLWNKGKLRGREEEQREGSFDRGGTMERGEWRMDVT